LCALNLPSSNRPGSVGRPVGCEIAIFDGAVAVRGAGVAPAYANGAREPIADPVSGWYRTGDTGHLDADGFLYITGRLNELINVGGEKVAPGMVEEALTSHPAVADAVAFPLPHPTLGQHVAAAVVLRANATVQERQLVEHAAQLLPRTAVPNVVHLVPEIARDGSGKVRRHELTATFARDTRVEASVSNAADDPLLLALSRIWEDVLEYAPVARDENFFAAGGDSLRAIHVMNRIEADLGVTMSEDTLLFAPTIRELAQAVVTQAKGTNRNRIVTLRATGSRPPLFYYDSDVNGGGLYARFLQAALDPEQPIYVVRPNGALGDAIPESVDAMAAADAALIATTVPSATYRLAGFCAGGIVAYEVARHLERAGSAVDVVALIGSAAPNASLEPLWTWTSRASRFLSQRNKVRVYRFVRSIANAVLTRSYPVEIFNAISWLSQSFAPPTPADAAYVDRLLRYFPKRTARSIDLVWAEDDRLVVAGDPSMGWRRVAPVRRHSVRGNHMTVLTDHLSELGLVLRRIFDSADG
jgi:thioesterase domain-containing protein/acyl carrier protein